MLSFPQTLNALALAALLTRPAVAQQSTPSTTKAAGRAARATTTTPAPTASPAAPAGGPAWQVAIHNPVAHSPRDLSRLTAAYYQVDVLSEGAGLGLWLSSRILKLHGSCLQLTEEAGVFMAAMVLPKAQ